MTVCTGQSGCLSASALENRARTREGEWLSMSGFPSLVGGKPIWARKRYHGLAKNRVARLPSQRIAVQKVGPRKRRYSKKNAGAAESIPGSYTEKNAMGTGAVEAHGMPVFSATSRVA